MFVVCAVSAVVVVVACFFSFLALTSVGFESGSSGQPGSVRSFFVQWGCLAFNFFGYFVHKYVDRAAVVWKNAVFDMFGENELLLIYSIREYIFQNGIKIALIG